MSNRIPPSLVWLIDKRARIDGEMKKTQQSLERLTRLLARLETAEKRLAALDAEIANHPLSLEPKKSGTYATQHHRRLPLPKGELTRCIMECLGQANGNPVTRAEMLEFIFARYPQFNSADYYRRWIWDVVKARLKILVERGVAQRHHDRRTHVAGVWSSLLEAQS